MVEDARSGHDKASRPLLEPQGQRQVLGIAILEVHPWVCDDPSSLHISGMLLRVDVGIDEKSVAEKAAPVIGT